MKPSSSRSEPATGLFGAIFARGEVAATTSDHAWLQAMLDVEGALATALAAVGRCPDDVARQIGEACRADRFDVDAIGLDAAAGGNPVMPLVRALTEAVPEGARDWVHRGATSQDVMDPAAMLIARRSLDVIQEDLVGAADAVAGLAERLRDTPMLARTLLQPALPTTFGALAAGWLSGLDAATTDLERIRRDGLAVQLGGAAGTLAVYGADGPRIVTELARALDLCEPAVPWHTERSRIGELAGALSVASGVMAKAATDIVLLSQAEVGEVREGTPGRGGSSAMPQKRNPVAAISALACARQAPGLAATLLGSMDQELQRAAGAWHAEWLPLTNLLRLTGSAAAWLSDSLANLDVDAQRMRQNLEAQGPSLLSERLVEALAAEMGREQARSAVEEAAREPTTDGFLRAIGREDLREQLDPTTYLGSAGAFVDRALAAHQAQARSSHG